MTAALILAMHRLSRGHMAKAIPREMPAKARQAARERQEGRLSPRGLGGAGLTGRTPPHAPLTRVSTRQGPREEQSQGDPCRRGTRCPPGPRFTKKASRALQKLGDTPRNPSFRVEDILSVGWLFQQKASEKRSAMAGRSVVRAPALNSEASRARFRPRAHTRAAGSPPPVAVSLSHQCFPFSLLSSLPPACHSL